MSDGTIQGYIGDDSFNNILTRGDHKKRRGEGYPAPRPCWLLSERFSNNLARQSALMRTIFYRA